LLNQGIFVDGDTAMVNNVAYKMHHETFSSRIEFEHNTLLTSVTNGTCAIINDTTKICFTSKTYDYTLKKDKLDVKFYQLKPDVKVTRTISSSFPFLMDEVEVTVVITNILGDIDATDFVYMDAYPEEFVFTYLDNVQAKDNVISWNGRVRKGSDNSVTLKYKFKIKKKVDISLRGEYYYFDGEKMTDRQYTYAIDFKPKSLVDLTTKVAYTSTYVGRTNNLTINLTRAYKNESIDAKIRIVIPDNLVVESFKGDLTTLQTRTDLATVAAGTAEGSKESFTIYEWSGTITNQSKAFEFWLYGRRVGSSDVRIYLYYEDPNDRIRKGFDLVNYTEELTQNFEIISKDIILATNLQEGEKLESYQTKNFTAYVVNTNRGAYLKDVDIRIYTNTSEPVIITKHVDWMAVNQQIDFKFNLTADEIKSDRSVKFNMTASYLTEFGDNYTINLDRTIQLKSIKDFTITATADKTTLDEEEKTYFTVKVNNPRLVDIEYVTVADRISNFTLTKGVNSRILHLKSDKIADIYTYEIMAPKVRQDTIININTSVKYESHGKNYSFSKLTPITVKPKKLDLTITRTYSSSAVFQGQLIDVDYTLSNGDIEQAKDVYIFFPTQPEIDAVGSILAKVPKLDPGEKIILHKASAIRGKYNRSIEIQPAFIYYRDIDDNLFSMNSTKESLTFKYSFIDGPAIVIYKNATSNVGPYFPVTVTIQNLGSAILDKLVINDGDKEWQTGLSPGESKTFNYIQSSPPGEYNLDKAVATYSYGGLNFTTASNKPKIYVSKDVLIANESKKEGKSAVDLIKEKLSTSETGTKVAENIGENVEKTKSWFSNVKEYFSRLFSGKAKE
ncbi:MAG: hypothetical protein Q8O89_09040, partial [Nanoarchaeota archaeon]|nr:hypothetical protein [Nanoarchaeota archaeon]